MNRVQLTAEQVEILLHLGEDYYVDYKAKEVAPAKLSRWVAAFANSSGGDIYIGVAEPTRGFFKWDGFERPEDANAHVAVLQGLFPASDSFHYDLLSAASKPGYVLRLEVGRTPNIRKASDGEVYQRVAAAVERVRSDEALQVLRRQKGIESFEQETVNIPVELVTESEEVAKFVETVVPVVDPSTWLRKQLLIRENRPTVACAVLFADEPQVALPKASVLVYRYATTDVEGSRDQLVDEKTYLIEGSADAQIREAVLQTTQLIEEVKDLELNPVLYPERTLHEIITNAIIHRDYGIADSVHVRIFDDRVEVESPGLLPGHVTPKNILKARFSRNQSIERWLHKFPDAPNKNVGEGLNTAFDAMKRMRLADPEIIERDGNVLVLIRHQHLDSPATSILQYLEEHSTITNSQARELTNVPRDHDMRKILRGMIQRGALEQVPGTTKGGVKYRLRRAGKLGSPDGSVSV